MIYDDLLDYAVTVELDTYEVNMVPTIKGLFGEGTIFINKMIPTYTEKACVLAEEIGHHHTSVGNILNLSNIDNRRQELRARQWGHHRIIPFEKFVEAHKSKIKGRYDLAEFLGVTEEFLQEAADRYRDKYGLCRIVDDRHAVTFDPLGIIELIN